MTRFGAIVQALRDAGQLVTPPEAIPPSDITGVTDDSRAVQDGFLFCAVRGTQHDGHRFIPDAASRGAAVMLVSDAASAVGPSVVVRDGRTAARIAAATWYGDPSRSFRMAGITGTNGKSTTVWVLRHLLNATDNAASIGTLGAFDGAGRPVEQDALTTPGPVGLQATLRRLADRGAVSLVMEVSSHALDQGRVDGLEFDAAVFTNLSHDHLDYHGSLGAYLKAKERLLDYVRQDGVVVVNSDAREWDGLAVPAGVRRVGFGRSHEAAVRASEATFAPDGTRCVFGFDEARHDVALPLIGEFNVSNALAAAATAWALGEPAGDIVQRLATVPQVPGRMERLVTGETTVLRDYAHTPDALERAIAAVRSLVTGRLIVLFGCGGDRDRRKRAPMGRIAVSGADLAVVTSDNPRTEDPERIIDDIVEGMEGHAFLRVTDRRAAIERSLEMLQPGDCLVLAGKGHETYQVVGTEKQPFDEREIVAAACAAGR